MADVFSKEKRSWVMSRIRGRDTKPEIAVRSMLHRLGYRFTVRGPRNRGLPGKPDVVLPKWGVTLFVNGCFWHGHEGCKHFRLPKTRRKFWRDKIYGNRARDARTRTALEQLGWKVVTIWACELNTAASTEALLGKLPGLIERSVIYQLEENRSTPIAAEKEAEYGGDQRKKGAKSI